MSDQPKLRIPTQLEAFEAIEEGRATPLDTFIHQTYTEREELETGDIQERVRSLIDYVEDQMMQRFLKAMGISNE